MANGITVTTHYQKSDTECGSDYCDVHIDVTVKDKRYHMDYGDAYHDKGHEKAEGFVDALKIVFGSKFPVIRVDVADREDWD